MQTLPLCVGENCFGDNRGELPHELEMKSGRVASSSGQGDDKSAVQMGGREVSAGGQEGFQMYFSDVVGPESELGILFGEELGKYKLVEKEL